MVMNNDTTRRLSEEFHADTRFAALRAMWTSLQSRMVVLRGNVKGFREGKTTLTPETIERLRDYVLQMLQLQQAMIEGCEVITDDYAQVKARILSDFDTEEAKAYMVKVNGWVRLIEGDEL